MRTQLVILLVVSVSLFAVEPEVAGSDSSSDERSTKIAELNRRIAEAQKSGNKEMLSEAMKEYEVFLDKHPDLKRGLMDLKKKDQQVVKHRHAADEHFRNKRFLEAIQEYEKCLDVMIQGGGLFALARSGTLVEIGRVYQELANDSFRKALSEKIPPNVHERLQSQIKSIKQKNIASNEIEQTSE